MRPLFNSLQWKKQPIDNPSSSKTWQHMRDIMTVHSCSKAASQRIHRKAKNSSLSFLTADTNVTGLTHYSLCHRRGVCSGIPMVYRLTFCLGSQALSQCLSGPSLSMPHLTPQLRKALSVPPGDGLWWCSRFITCPGTMESRLDSSNPGKVKVFQGHLLRNRRQKTRYLPWSGKYAQQ